jgi:tetratricopeptide (TPR) repeat protein
VGELGDFAAARPLAERALAIAETAYGPEHPDVGTSLNNLALIVGELGDFAAARPLAERALAVTETAYGPEHPIVGAALSNLAGILGELGDFAAARPLAEPPPDGSPLTVNGSSPAHP